MAWSFSFAITKSTAQKRDANSATCQRPLYARRFTKWSLGTGTPITPAAMNTCWINAQIFLNDGTKHRTARQYWAPCLQWRALSSRSDSIYIKPDLSQSRAYYLRQ